MKFDVYQERASATAIYPDMNTTQGLVYTVLGLCGETGEVAEKVKKILRDKEGRLGTSDREEIAKELGDILWYVSAAADELGFSLSDIAHFSLTKVESRKERGVLGGSGDNR
jgi:NTP pyrophosphatase (non-canonical NTP hydrolase)